MARSHPSEVIAAVKALAHAGAHAGTIDRKLRAGDVDGLAPYEMPRSTIQFHARAAKRELDPLPADDDGAGNYLEREAFRIIQRELDAIKRDQNRRRLSATEIRRAGACADELAKIRKRLRDQARPASDPDRVKGGEAKRDAPATPESLLDRIASDIDGRRPASDSEDETHAPTRAREGTRVREAGDVDPISDDHATQAGTYATQRDASEAGDDDDNAVHHARTHEHEAGTKRQAWSARA